MTTRNPFANWPRGGYPSSNKPVSELKPPPANISKPKVPLACPTCAGTGWYRGRLCPEYCSDSFVVPSKAPSSPVETTAGSERRPDHTGVIRPADEAESIYARSDPARFNTYLDAIYDSQDWVKFSSRRRITEAVMAVADAEHADLPAEVERLAQRNLKQALTINRYQSIWDRLRDEIAEPDATIERLWAQLNEATNTPHNDPEFGFDKTAALSDPGEGRQVHQWRHGRTAEQVQAADDRRAL